MQTTQSPQDSRIRITATTAETAKRWSHDQVSEYIAAHDDDQLDGNDLEAAFLGVMGRKADDEDREAGLWSLICNEVA